MLRIWMFPQVQRMIRREVKTEIKENKDELQSLIETIQQLDSEADYESCFQNLEVSCALLVGKNTVFLLILTQHFYNIF